MLTPYEVARLTAGLADTRGYFWRCFIIARAAFLGGATLDAAIFKARKKFAF